MKKILLLNLILFVSLSCTNSTSNETAKPKKAFQINSELIEEFKYDDRLNPNNSKLKFSEIEKVSIGKFELVFNEILDWENDPGDFYQIKVFANNEVQFSVTNFEGWIKSNELFKVINFNGNNVLILKGYHYSSEKAPLITMIELNNLKPRLIFNKKADLISSQDDDIKLNYNDDIYSLEIENNKLKLIKK